MAEGEKLPDVLSIKEKIFETELLTIEGSKEVVELIEAIKKTVEALRPLIPELVHTFQALSTALGKWDVAEAAAALQSLRQTLYTTSELFAAIDQIDEQRLITLVAAFEKIADDLSRIPTDVALPSAGTSELPGAAPILRPSPAKPEPPLIPPAPTNPRRCYAPASLGSTRRTPLRSPNC